MKARYCLFSCLALAACDDGYHREAMEPVVVYFAQPFPASAPDLLEFLPRDRQQYTALADTARVFRLGEKILTVRYSETIDLRGALLDSLKLPRRPDSGLVPGGLRYRVQALAADSFRLRAESLDTLLKPTTVQRRRTRGQLVFTLSPQSRRAIGQVSGYAGLWLDLPTSGPATATVE